MISKLLGSFLWMLEYDQQGPGVFNWFDADSGKGGMLTKTRKFPQSVLCTIEKSFICDHWSGWCEWSVDYMQGISER